MASDRSEIAILVVEDEPFLRLDLVDTFLTAGYDVLQATSGEGALQHLQNGKRIDAVVTDIQLGGDLTGWDVAEKFRAAHSDMLVIYVSGNAENHGRRVAGNIFFSKPCRTWDVLKVCRGLGRVIGNEFGLCREPPFHDRASPVTACAVVFGYTSRPRTVA